MRASSGMIASVVAVAWVAACGGSTETEGSGGAGAATTTTTTTTTTSGSGAAGGSGGATAATCPIAAPTEGTQCETESLACTYGDDLQPGCRDRFVCTSGQWSNPPSVEPCYEPSTADCPSSEPTSTDGCSPTPVGTYCEYAAELSVCTCTDQDCSGACQLLDPPEWRCYGAPDVSGCPALTPNEGTACEVPGAVCSYLGGACQNGGVQAECQQGTWHWARDVQCPA